jgi:hypothetical protein
MALRDGSGAVRLTGTRNARVKVARFDYDFSVDGGAVGAITLRGNQIPANCVILDAIVDVQTIVTSGGAATVSLDLEAAGDLRAAATLSSTPAALNAVAVKSLLDPVKTSATRSVVATVGAFALTAGVFSVYLTYVEV